jgi:dihydrofolate reductase
MARKVTANAYMTLDGRGVFPEYPGSTREIEGPSALFQHMWIERYDDVDTVVMGRRSFLGHQRVWSGKARKPKDPPYQHDYSSFLDRTDKVCLSRTVKKSTWENSRIMKGDLAKVVAKLKSEKGRGNILIEGGPAVVNEVVRRQLADDYWFFVMPVVYGRGPRYWSPIAKGQSTLKFLEMKPGEDGELLLHYATVRGK